MGIRLENRSAAWVLWIQLAVITFWMVTVSVLIKRNYFHAESRMTPVPADRVAEMFFAWTEGAELTILKDGQRVGQMSLSAQLGKKMPGDIGKGRELREIAVAGSLDSFSVLENAGAGEHDKGVYWRGLMEVDDDLNFPKGDFVLRMPELGLSVQFGFDHPVEKISLKVRSKGEQLFEYEGSPAGLSALPELGKVGRLLPLQALLGGKMSDSMVDAWAPGITGRFGSAEVAGRKMLVYQLILKNKGSGNKPGEEVKLSLSETGEPLMVQTAWGYEALAEVLVPVAVDENAGGANQ